jgi:hypothetical protein
MKSLKEKEQIEAADGGMGTFPPAVVVFINPPCRLNIIHPILPPPLPSPHRLFQDPQANASSSLFFMKMAYSPPQQIHLPSLFPFTPNTNFFSIIL